MMTADSHSTFKNEVYEYWKNKVLPNEIMNQNLLKSLKNWLPQNGLMGEAWNFHHFNLNEAPKRYFDFSHSAKPSDRFTESIPKALLNRKDPRVINELENMIVIPESFHKFRDVKDATDIEDAYERYFQIYNENRLKIEEKKYDLCIRALNIVKKKMEAVLNKDHILLTEVDKIIKSLEDLKDTIEDRLENEDYLKDLSIM